MTLNKYAYAGANPVMYADPSGYMFTLAECLTATNMQNILRSAKVALINGTLGGAFGALDAMSAKGDVKDVLKAFCIGVPRGIVGGAVFRGIGGVLSKFMSAKLANATLALTGFGFGMFSAGYSLGEGEYFQALYRAGVSTLGISLWYGQYGAETNKILQEALQNLKKGNGGGGQGATAGIGESGSNTVNPKDVNFMQSSIKNQTGENTVLGNAEALKSGTLKATDLPEIRIWQDADGKLWTLDHRRLAAFRIAELDSVPFRWATNEEVANQMWKITTETNGTSIKLKLGNGQSMTIQ